MDGLKMSMSGAPAPPPAPDPVATAAAQAKMNKETAVAQTGLNSINQITPDGSLTYDETGRWSDGTPRFTATTALSPGQQGIYNTNQATQQNIATIGRDQSARIGDLLGKPLQLGNEATEGRLMDLGMRRLTPQFSRDEEALRTRLANSGIRAGSAAFDAEMGNFGQTKNDAITQLLLSGRGQANQELMTERNQPINEITALMSGSQVSNPAFVNTPQTQVAGTDYAGMVRDNYNAQMAGWNAQNQRDNAMMGGLFGLAGNLGGMGIYKYSDRNLKTDIARVGTLDNGLPVYRYRMKSGGPFEIGLMADDVLAQKPSAVAPGERGLMVDYLAAVEA